MIGSSCRILLLACAAFWMTPVAAEDNPVYESLSDVSIGRVFFSTSQRTRLDRLRGSRGPHSVRSQPSAKASSRPGNPDAAGFIVSKSSSLIDSRAFSSRSASSWRSSDSARAATAGRAREPCRGSRGSGPEERGVEQ